MEKLNMDDYLFHGISAYYQEGYSSNIEEESEILNSILKTKYIASRQYLEDILDDNKREKLELIRTVEYYVKENSVSIYFTRHTNVSDYASFYTSSYWDNNLYFAYYSYKNKPSIILNANLLEKNSRIYSKWIMSGEIQIKDKIPLQYFVGIALPNIKLNYFLNRTKNSFDIPTEFESQMKLDFMNLPVEEFVDTYYQEVILFERVLQETGIRLPLYHTETGERILSSSEEIEYVRGLKKTMRS